LWVETTMTRFTRWPFVFVGLMTVQCAGAAEPDSGFGGFAQGILKRKFEASMQAMNRPVEPFRVIGNIYYVGASDVSSFLLTTPEGHILIDSGFEETVPLIRQGVRKLGFRFEDVKILLNSHAHLDHAGGHSLVKELTGARIVMSEADSALLARGGKGDFLPLGDPFVSYKPVRADRVVGEGETVSLGGLTLTAHLTPGHTKGCTTWTTIVEHEGQRLDVVFFGSTTLLPGVRLSGNAKYPGIADDYATSFRRLRALPCDVFLAPHGVMYGMEEKVRRLKSGATANPFIDPEGYRAFVERAEKVFLDQLGRETPAAVTNR
jgi:metallo-beta-lactamase class B